MQGRHSEWLRAILLAPKTSFLLAFVFSQCLLEGHDDGDDSGEEDGDDDDAVSSAARDTVNSNKEMVEEMEIAFADLALTPLMADDLEVKSPRDSGWVRGWFVRVEDAYVSLCNAPLLATRENECLLLKLQIWFQIILAQITHPDSYAEPAFLLCCRGCLCVCICLLHQRRAGAAGVRAPQDRLPFFGPRLRRHGRR